MLQFTASVEQIYHGLFADRKETSDVDSEVDFGRAICIKHINTISQLKQRSDELYMQLNKIEQLKMNVIKRTCLGGSLGKQIQLGLIIAQPVKKTRCATTMQYSSTAILDLYSCFNIVRRLCSIFCVRRLKFVFFCITLHYHGGLAERNCAINSSVLPASKSFCAARFVSLFIKLIHFWQFPEIGRSQSVLGRHSAVTLQGDTTKEEYAFSDPVWRRTDLFNRSTLGFLHYSLT